MARPIQYAPVCTPLEEVAVCAGPKVLIEVDEDILLIAGSLQGILGKQNTSRLIHLLNIIIILNYYIQLWLIKLF